MFTHPDRIGQLADQDHRHMLAQARQRALSHQHGRRSSTMPDAAVRITRRLTTAITRPGVMAAQTAGALGAWGRTSPAGQLPEPGRQSGPGH